MSAFTPASEVLLRHSDDFEQSRILFAGDLQDDLPARLDTAASRAHTQQFLAEEQTGSPVPVDEFTFSTAGGHGYFCRWREPQRRAQRRTDAGRLCAVE